MKLDAKTIVALTGLVAVLLGGGELRLAVSKLDDKVERLEDRIAVIERTLSPRPLAANHQR